MGALSAPFIRGTMQKTLHKNWEQLDPMYHRCIIVDSNGQELATLTIIKTDEGWKYTFNSAPWRNCYVPTAKEAKKVAEAAFEDECKLWSRRMSKFYEGKNMPKQTPISSMWEDNIQPETNEAFSTLTLRDDIHFVTWFEVHKDSLGLLWMREGGEGWRQLVFTKSFDDAKRVVEAMFLESVTHSKAAAAELKRSRKW